MAETGTDISVIPASGGESRIRVCGTIDGVGKAAWQLKELHKEQQEKKAFKSVHALIEELHILSRVTSSRLADIRQRCGSVMIAMTPSSGGAMTAYIGPGEREYVFLAKRELNKCLETSTIVDIGSAKSTDQPEKANPPDDVDADKILQEVAAEVDAHVKSTPSHQSSPAHLADVAKPDAQQEVNSQRKEVVEPLIQEVGEPLIQGVPEASGVDLAKEKATVSSYQNASGQGSDQTSEQPSALLVPRGSPQVHGSQLEPGANNTGGDAVMEEGEEWV